MPLFELSARAVAGGFCLAALAACSRDRAPDPVAARNVVIVCIDTLRADHVAAYGYARDTSPFIDDLAEGGTLFERASAQSDWTVPSTATLLTSRYPSQHGAGITGDLRLLADDSHIVQISTGVETLSSRLAGNGFSTGLFSANPFLFGAFKRGFDVADVRRRGATELTRAAVDWLRTLRGGRFFLYLQYMDMHHPTEPPHPFFDLFPQPESGERTRKHGVWDFSNIRSKDDFRDPAFRSFRAHHVALYDASLRYVDASVKALWKELRDLGLADETLLVITSDHGEEFWDHAVEESTQGDPRGFWGVGHGHSMYEELLHVPLIIRGPGVAKGVRSGCGVRLLDVVPTVLDLLGLGADGLGGTSLRGLMRRSAGACPDLPLIAESPAYGPNSSSVAWKGRKLIVRENAPDMLFDLRSDAEERHDISSGNPQLVAALRAILLRELSRDPSQPVSEAIPLDDETREELRALGYLR